MFEAAFVEEGFDEVDDGALVVGGQIGGAAEAVRRTGSSRRATEQARNPAYGDASFRLCKRGAAAEKLHLKATTSKYDDKTEA